MNCARSLSFIASVAVFVAALTAGGRVHAASITVDKSADEDTNGTCTLWDAITAANTDTATNGCPAGSGADTITLGVNITLADNLPKITSKITIEGAEYDIDGNDQHIIFWIDGGDLTVNNITLTGGNAGSYGGAINAEDGSALTVTNSRLEDNHAGLLGGAIATSNTHVVIKNSVFVGNSSGSLGGALSFFSNSPDDVSWTEGDTVYTLVIDQTTFGEDVPSGCAAADISADPENEASANGGAMDLHGGDVTIRRSSFIGNYAGVDGGAIHSSSYRFLFENNTISCNRADANGGGMYSILGDLILRHNTIYQNSAGSQGGGLYTVDDSEFIPEEEEIGIGLYLQNSIIAGSTGGGDCHAADEIDHNIGMYVADGTCEPACDATDGPINLGELQGEPAYHPLLDGSIAINRADLEVCSIPSATETPSSQEVQSQQAKDFEDMNICEELDPEQDQIGTNRPMYGNCDIGAIESRTGITLEDVEDGDGGVGGDETDTPIPADTDTPVPPDTDTPVPADTDTPVPPDTDTPVPTDTDEPPPQVQEDTDTPVPTATDPEPPDLPDPPQPEPTDTPSPTATDPEPPEPPVPPQPEPTDTPPPTATDPEPPVPPQPEPTDTPMPTATDPEPPVPPQPEPTDTPPPTATDPEPQDPISDADETATAFEATEESIRATQTSDHATYVVEQTATRNAHATETAIAELPPVEQTAISLTGTAIVNLPPVEQTAVAHTAVAQTATAVADLPPLEQTAISLTGTAIVNLPPVEQTAIALTATAVVNLPPLEQTAIALTGTAVANLPPLEQTAFALTQSAIDPATRCKHTVEVGDTLFQLALTYNTTVEAFRSINQLTADAIYVGSELIVPDCYRADDEFESSTLGFSCQNLYDSMVVRSTSRVVGCREVDIGLIDKHPALASGMIAAIDVFGYVESGVEICFRNIGELVFLDRVTEPPTPKSLSSYNNAVGMTCGEVENAGTLVLVAAVIERDTFVELTSCKVTTTQTLRLRDEVGSSTALRLIPYNVTLDTFSRTNNWFNVNFLGSEGWISARYVRTDGICE